ncbi:MAG: polyphosphate kinase 1, partial [Phycicoccus sp.]
MNARTGTEAEARTAVAVPTSGGPGTGGHGTADGEGAATGDDAAIHDAATEVDGAASARRPAGARAGRDPSDALDAGDGSVLGGVSIASASATETRHHPPRAANGRFIRAPSAASEPEALPADRFLDREISWLQFNERVLQLAADDSVPLLERARYLSIFASNLDEFFMVRVAGLKRRIATGIAVRSVSRLEPREVLEQTSIVAHELMTLHARVYGEQVRPALEAEGVSIVRWDELADHERARLAKVFADRLFPVLTPLAVDPAHPFPYISGLSLNLAVILVNPRTGKEHFARIKVPPLLPRLMRIEPGPDESPLADLYDTRFVPLEDVIAAHLDALFPGMEVREHFTFRVTRNEDLEVEEDDAENLLTALERELTRRRFGPPVRLEVEDAMDDHVLDLIVRELGVAASEVYRLPAPLDLRTLSLIADLERSDLHFESFVPRTNADLAPTESANARDILAAIRKQDVLLQHPYDSFSTSVQLLLEQAAADPRVLAIKQTLYRTSGDSPVIDALIDAAEAGKQVLAVVEIKARFDEENNISWARKLERAGVHVVYGIVGLKTHAKLSLVIRQEAEGLKRYCHVGTGNYNPKTARLYEDLGLLTDDPQVGEDLSRLFNQLSGIAPRSKFRRLLVAPRSVRSGLIGHIKDEIAHERDHPGSGHIA